MNLPFIKNFNKKVLPSFFLVLVLRDEKVNAVIFEEIEGKVKIIGQKEEHFTSSIDDVSLEEFLQMLDKAISSAESSLPENIQTQKTIFGLKESWTQKDQIKKEHLAKLKKASEELGLTPIGFLVNSQAISHLLQKEEGAPISAILVEVNKKSVTVTLIRAGKIIETQSSEIHETVPFTVDTLLKHFNIPEILPSRIIVFNGKEDLSQDFITHAWSKSLPFLHLPQITNLPEGFDAKSVLAGAASQMGFEILEKDVPFRQRRNTNMHKEPMNTASEENTQNKEKEKAGPTENIEEEDFGFAKDKDVAKMPSENTNEEVSTQAEENKDKPKSFQPTEIIDSRNENIAPVKNAAIKISPFTFLASFIGIVPRLIGKINLKKIPILASRLPRGKTGLIAIGALILTIASIFSYITLVSSTVEITIEPEIVQQDKSIIFSTKDETNPDKNIIKGEFLPVSQEGTLSTPATGKKDVGDKARGTITIFSTLAKEQTFSKGTTVKSSSNLVFVIDETVKVASASGASDPKTVKAAVVANDIGKEYNLPSGAKFTVEDLSSSEVEAKNDSPFSGGTKKQVTVVSANDEDKLQKDLPEKLKEQALKSLEEQVLGDNILLPVFISNELSKESLSTKVGDEASQVTLTATVEYQGLSYKKEDLIAFSKSLLEKNISSDKEIDFNNVKAGVKDFENIDDETVEAILNIKALLLPKFENSKISKDIKGKSFKDVEEILYKLPQVADVDISLSPSFPFLPKKLPMIEKNIKIIIKNG